MAQTPVCKKCIVTKELLLIIAAYEEFKRFMNYEALDFVTDHARGYYHGQLAIADDVIRDVTRLIPHIQAEAALRAKSDKGL